MAAHGDQGRPLVVLMDANARLGSVQSEAVGPHAPEEENEPGAALHACLQARGLFIPQTFPQA
eukprot:6804991-Lingulodinium_polyedra.AAC.1